MHTRLLSAQCRLFLVLPLLLIAGCSEKPQNPAATDTTAVPAKAPTAAPAAVEKGMYFKPDLAEFSMHNEYDADGDGDGVNETRVQRYINSVGDSAFSMTTGERLWAWSLDVKNDDADIHRNYVIRDSNCDGVFDERYALDAEFHVPECLAAEGASSTPGSV